MPDFVPDFDADLPSFLLPVLSFLARSKARDVSGLKSVETLSLLALKVFLAPALEGAWMLDGMLVPAAALKCDAWLIKVKSILLVSKSTRATFTMSLSPNLNRTPVRSPSISWRALS